MAELALPLHSVVLLLGVITVLFPGQITEFNERCRHYLRLCNRTNVIEALSGYSIELLDCCSLYSP